VEYYRATGDDDFFLRVGAEILLDTARFWASQRVGPMKPALFDRSWRLAATSLRTGANG
jgi:hypothetical protein